jgi:hypothetical protein
MMRRLLPVLCAWLICAPANAQQFQPPAPPAREGYAFDTPRILAQQRLFGIANGVELLANACRAVPETASASEAAYALWRVSQETPIATAVADLGDYYFGKRDTGWQVVAQKMGLKHALELAPDSDELRAACASLPEALLQPRYDLAERFRLEELMARAVMAVEIEARERHCRQRFAAQLLELHDARYALWREINLPVLAENNKALAAAWPTDGPAASFDDWYAELRSRTQAGGTVADCLAFSESLKRPEMALRNVFRMPPPLQSEPIPQ